LPDQAAKQAESLITAQLAHLFDLPALDASASK
jgi:hypothetical protein